MLMHMHHDSLRGLRILVEESLQHVHDKLNRRVIVVQEQYAVEAWTLGLRLGLGDDGGAGRPRSAALGIVIIPEMRYRRPWHRAGVRFGWYSAHDNDSGGVSIGMAASRWIIENARSR